MHVENRRGFIKKLSERKIPSSIVHARIDNNSIFSGKTPGLINQEKFEKSHISIPVHSNLKNEEVELIISTIKSGW
jgi:dTDP-4-amino-4,6-dideoxygalactose transaminase